MDNIDLVELIERNPITKLSSTYNNKLLTKIKENFTNDQQTLFITSFYCYLNYDQENDYVIDFDNIWSWLGFTKKVNAKRVLDKNFTYNIDYKILLLNSEEQKNYHGGNNREIIMLNIKTFKMFCIKSETKKAKKIHEYYIKLEYLLHEVIQEEVQELKDQLEIKNKEIKQIEETKEEEYGKRLEKDREYERHKILLKEFKTAHNIIYIMKVKQFDNGLYIIRIGESRRGIEGRYNDHKTSYGKHIVILDCFVVNRCKDFEYFLHHHNDIKYSKVTDLEGHENENELFLIGKELTYKKVLDIINENIKYFNDYTYFEIEKLKLEQEKLKTLASINDSTIITFIKESTELNQKLCNKIEQLEKTNKEILEKLNSIQTRTTNNFNEQLTTIGPRLQKINPETLHLIKVYETVSECMKENSKIKRSSLHKAIMENTIYCDFRWLYVDRELNPNIIYKIEPTKQTKEQHLGYIAKVNKDKTKIINVYLNRKTASLLNGYSSSTLDDYVKYNTIKDDYYYILYENCDNKLKEDFKQLINGEPILYKNGVGQYKDNVLIKEFISKYECSRQLKIGDKSLTKALNNGFEYNKYYYKYIQNKVKCI